MGRVIVAADAFGDRRNARTPDAAAMADTLRKRTLISTRPVVTHGAVGDRQGCTCTVVVNAPPVASDGLALRRNKLGGVAGHEAAGDCEGGAAAIGAVVKDAAAGHGCAVAADSAVVDRQGRTAP